MNGVDITSDWEFGEAHIIANNESQDGSPLPDYWRVRAHSTREPSKCVYGSGASAEAALAQAKSKAAEMGAEVNAVNGELYDLPGLEVGDPLMPASVTSHTLVGYANGPYPMPSGNCFSVRVGADEEYRIVNFCYENLREVIRRGVTWPIQILPIARKLAVIHDTRIPDSWYSEQWCEICCPTRFLPPPQRLAHLRDIERGHRIETGTTVQYPLPRQHPVLAEPDVINPKTT